MQHELTERMQGIHVGQVGEIQVVHIIFVVFHLMP